MAKKLYRSRRSKMFGGVAGGIANYFDIDPVFVRLFFVAATVFEGVGIILYIILWIVVPFAPFSNRVENNDEEQTSSVEKKKSQNLLLGGTLILAGIYFLIDDYIPNISFEYIFAAILIGSGSFLLYHNFKNSFQKEL